MKNILNEQGATGYNCEIQQNGQCNCQANLLGCGQFPTLQDCQNNTNPNTGPHCPTAESCCATTNCGLNPGPDCWYCHGGDFSSGIQTFVYSPSHSNPAQVGYPTGGICHQFSEGGMINQNNMLNTWLPNHGGTVQQGGSIVVWADNQSCLDAGCGPNPPVGWTPPAKAVPTTHNLADMEHMVDREFDDVFMGSTDDEESTDMRRERIKENLDRIKKLF